MSLLSWFRQLTRDEQLKAAEQAAYQAGYKRGAQRATETLGHYRDLYNVQRDRIATFEKTTGFRLEELHRPGMADAVRFVTSDSLDDYTLGLREMQSEATATAEAATDCARRIELTLNAVDELRSKAHPLDGPSYAPSDAA